MNLLEKAVSDIYVFLKKLKNGIFNNLFCHPGPTYTYYFVISSRPCLCSLNIHLSHMLFSEAISFQSLRLIYLSVIILLWRGF